MFARRARMLPTANRTGTVPSLGKSGARVAAASWRAALAPRMAAVAESVPKISMPPQATQGWEVHKFGGASLNDAALYKTVGDLLVEESKGRGEGAVPTMAIVSAMGGMTDQLIKVITSALIDLDASTKALDDAITRQVTTLKELAPPNITDPIEASIRADGKDILTMVKSLRMLRTVPGITVEVVTGFGEIWSAQTLYAYIKAQRQPTSWLDARDVLTVKSDGAGLGEKGSAATGGVEPLYGITADKFSSWWKAETDKHKFDKLDYKSQAPIVVVTGFVASTIEGVPTTLKRSGSDYSATIFAKLMSASRVTMWKNTDGVYTADPRRVPEAFSIPSLKFDEATELAYFGAQVLHPSAMVPCIDADIPVYVRNIFNRDFNGSVISGRSVTLQDADAAMRSHSSNQSDAGLASEAPVIPIKGITSIDNVSIVNLEGASLIGVPGVAQLFMEAMSSANINVLMITQASSESSICVVVPHDQGEKALAALKSKFELALARSTVNSVYLERDMSVVAIIGEGMAFSPGVAARFLKALAQARVNVRAIAQGSSERQIAAVVKAADATRALRSVHQAFTLSDTVVSVAVLGATGAVGTSFLRQLRHQANTALTTLGVQIKVTVAASSTKMVSDENFLGLDMENLSAQLESSAQESNLDKITEAIVSDINPHRVVVDLTNSDRVADYYGEWIKAGVHVIGSNKDMGSGDLKRYKNLKSALRFGTAQWQYGGTVGAALPVLSTADDLINTGDKVNEVYGCLSGTMAYVFYSYDEDFSFAEAARKACDNGFTATNIADDLEGTNAARKLVIIARELGFDLSLEDVECESLLPAGFDSTKTPSDEEVAKAGEPAWKVQSDMVLEALAAENDKMLERKRRAAAEGKRLRHVSHLDMNSGRARVYVDAVDKHSPLFRLNSDENLVTYKTERYNSSPLICKGGAAGAELTASGVLADLFRLSRSFIN